MSVLTCPACGETASPVIERDDLAVCACCGMFLHRTAAGLIERAAGLHADSLAPDDLRAFRHHRGVKRSAREQAHLANLQQRGRPQ